MKRETADGYRKIIAGGNWKNPKDAMEQAEVFLRDSIKESLQALPTILIDPYAPEDTDGILYNRQDNVIVCDESKFYGLIIDFYGDYLPIVDKLAIESIRDVGGRALNWMGIIDRMCQ